MFSVKFNGVAIPPFIKVTNVTKSLLPKVTINSTNINGMIGNRFNKVEFGEREITLSCKFMFDILDQAKVDECAKWLRGNNWKPSKLQFNNSSKYFMAICSSEVDLNDLLFLGEGDITFKCNDPLLYDIEYMTPFTGSVNVLNSGNTKDYPTIKMTCGGNSVIKVENTTNGTKVTVKGNFASGKELVIDCKKQYISYDGSSAMGGFYLDSDWITLEEGENHIVVTVTGGSSTSNKIYCQDSWI